MAWRANFKDYELQISAMAGIFPCSWARLAIIGFTVITAVHACHKLLEKTSCCVHGSCQQPKLEGSQGTEFISGVSNVFKFTLLTHGMRH
jgi:hypothetical protein